MGVVKQVSYMALCTMLLVGCQGRWQQENKIDENQQEYILSKVNNYQGLVKLYREKLSRKEDPLVRYKLANYYNLVEDYDSSLHYLQPLLEKSPNDKVYLLQAKNLTALDKKQQAYTAIKSALNLNDKNGDAYNMLGVLQAERGEFDAAYQSLNTARGLFVSEEQVVNNLAMLMILQENYQQAYDYLMPLYLRGHSTPSILHNLVYVLVKMKDYEQASNLIRSHGIAEKPETLISELMTVRTRVKRREPRVTDERQKKPVIAAAVSPERSKRNVSAGQPAAPAAKISALNSGKGAVAQASAGAMEKKTHNNSGRQSSPRQTEKINSITNARFGTHLKFSRLTFESVQAMSFEKLAQKSKQILRIRLNNVRHDDSITTILNNINKQIGSHHQDIKNISLVREKAGTLLLIVNFKRNIKTDIFRLPADKNKSERFVLDFK